MRLFLLTALTMVAFAANSVLNRMALVDPEMGPASFAAIRLGSGAVALVLLVAARESRFGALPGTWGGAGSLALYLLGFSFAYLTLDAGVGALILFGGVQLTMFAGALVARERILPRRWLGAGIAFVGLAYLLWPGAGATVDPSGAALMLVGALGWGLYSLVGRGAKDPLGATAGNFFWALPLAPVLWFAVGDGVTARGIVLAAISGVVTSGLGYALWYSVLPRIEASLAAVAQLTVPVIAFAGGAMLLGEALSLRFAIATVLVLGGVLISLGQRKTSSKGS